MINQTKTIKYPKAFNITNSTVDVSKGVESINQCLELLLMTSKGELMGDPNYGTRILEYIYQPNYIIMHDLLVDEIISAIDTYEHRISVMSSDIEISKDENTVTIKIPYTISKTGGFHVFTTSINKETNNA